jgi:hypothetical protein
LLLKNGDTNYSGIGFSTSSIYGNSIETVRIGTAPSRNLTLYNYAGYVSITENGNFGVNILTPNAGIDIYNSTQSQLWLHNAATGITATDGVRLALFNSKEANLRNFDGGLSISAEGDFQIITLGADNFRINSANGYIGIGNPATILAPLHVYNAENAASLLLQTDGATSYSEIAVRNASSVATSYFRQYSSSATGTIFGTSNANLATFFSNFASNFAIGTLNGGALIFGTSNVARLTIASFGESTFSSSVTVTATLTVSGANQNSIYLNQNAGGTSSGYLIGRSLGATDSQDFFIYDVAAGVTRLAIASNGAATFSSKVTTTGPANDWGLVVNGSGTVGQSYGANIRGGSNSSDVAFLVSNYVGGDILRILGNGNVGIGTSSPLSLLDVRGATPFIRITDTAVSGETGLVMDAGGATIRGGLTINYGTGEFKSFCGITGNGYFQTFHTNGSERMRITSGGEVCIAKTSTAFGTVGHAFLPNGQVSHVADGSTPFFLNRLSSDGDIALFYRSSSPVGSISVTTVSTSYNITSDYRLKEDFKEINGLEKLSEIKVYDFKWKADGSRMDGVIAHELAEVIPYAVTGEKDGKDMQGVDYSKLIPIMIKAIQEQQAQIEELKQLIKNK